MMEPSLNRMSAILRRSRLIRGPGHRAGRAGAVVQAESPARDGVVAGAGAGTRTDETRQRSAGQDRDADDGQSPGGRALETTDPCERALQSLPGEQHHGTGCVGGLSECRGLLGRSFPGGAKPADPPPGG